WLVLRPGDPQEARELRLDRDAMSALLAAARREGIPRLGDWIDYASGCRPFDQEEGSGIAISPLLPLGADPEWDALRLFEALGDSARRDLAAGRRLRLGSLGRAGLAQATRMIYGCGDWLSYAGQPLGFEPFGSSSVSTDMPVMPGDRFESTE